MQAKLRSKFSGEIMTLENEIRRLEERLSEANRGSENVKKENSRLEAALSEAMKTNERLEAENKRLEREREAFRGQIRKEFASELDALVDLKGDLAEAETSIQKLQGKLESEKRQRLEEAEKSEDDRVALQRKLAQAEREIAQLR